MTWQQRIVYKAGFAWRRLRTWWTLDTAVATLLALTLAGSAYTALGIRAVVDASDAAATQHDDASRASAERTRDAVQELERLLTDELARALTRHDREVASMLEAALLRLERLLGRPSRLIIRREGGRTVVIVSPQPIPATTSPGRGRNK